MAAPSADFDDGREAAEDHALAVEGHGLEIGLHALVLHGLLHARVPRLLGGPDDPKVQLRGFDRLTIAAGATATFTADITRRDISNWDTVTQNW